MYICGTSTLAGRGIQFDYIYLLLSSNFPVGILRPTQKHRDQKPVDTYLQSWILCLGRIDLCRSTGLKYRNKLWIRFIAAKKQKPVFDHYWSWDKFNIIDLLQVF